MTEDTPRERLARLETKVDHLESSLAAMQSKVDEMHAVLLQAKGARWVIIATAGIAGFVASYLPKVWTVVSGLPR